MTEEFKENWDSDAFYNYNADEERVDKRSILLAAREAVINTFQKREAREQSIREKNPAVMDAWIRYQTLLRLVGDSDERK